MFTSKLREIVNPFYNGYPKILQKAINKFTQLTGPQEYHLFDYQDNPEAERVIILISFDSETVHGTVDYVLNKRENWSYTI